nr:immunoglobulin light chain junction region [Macaca mulatta]MOX76949.1 immunoglobulin light chain junction region [Macaca mulatta]
FYYCFSYRSGSTYVF